MNLYDTLQHTSFKELDDMNTQLRIALLDIHSLFEELILSTEIKRNNYYVCKKMLDEINEKLELLNCNNLYSILRTIPLLIKLYNLNNSTITEILYETKWFEEWTHAGFIYSFIKAQ